MPHAVFHIIFAILIAEFIREYALKDKKKFPVYYIFIAGISAILPDLDIAAFWILYFFGYNLEQVHRTFTHTLFLPAISFLLALFTWKFKNKTLGRKHLKLHIIFLMISLGLTTHLILDALISGTFMPFYPFINFTLGLNLVNLLPEALQNLIEPSLDAAIFILWLFWLEYKHKISDFI